MKKIDLAWGLGLTCLALTGCPDDTVENPFETAEDSSDGGDDGMMTTTGMTTMSADTTMGAEAGETTDTGTTSMADESTTAMGEESTTAMGDDDDDSTSDSGTTGDTDGMTSTGEESSSDDGMMGTPCPADMIDMLPTTIEDSTTGQDDEFGGSCGGNGAPDLAYTLVAPSDGFYVFDTAGSSFDTVLYVLDGDCTGMELGCSDDADGLGSQSEVGVVLAQDQVVTVVVDSFGVAGGAFDLNVAVFGGTCPDGDIGSMVPQTSMGDTLASDNTLFGSCGGNLASDESFTFTAPQAGIYTFDTAGSDFDTVLYVREDCGGTELGCSDDISGVDTTSQVNVPLEMDEQVVVVVDGDSEDGNYVLNVTLDECPDADLPSMSPQTVMGSTIAEVDSSTPSCGFSNANDFSYTFVAPTTSTYIIDTNGSDFDTILYAMDGETCDGSVTLDCDDDGGTGTQSQILLNLVQDQQITIVVDGYSGNSGNFTLNIDSLGGVCPDADLGNMIPAMASGDTSMGSDDTIAASCGGLGSNDDTYTFTAPQDGTYFVTTPGSAFTPVIAVFDSADCSGAEIACADGSTGFGMMMGETVSIVVDGDGAEGAYNVEVDLDACPDGDLGNTVPQTVMDSTTGLSNSIDPSCGLGGSEDYGYLFTAPADGMYTFDTNGTGHDTVLHVIDGAVCGGMELDCDDDGGIGLQSEITLMLTQDQQVVVMVDGYNGADGPFTLNVN